MNQYLLSSIISSVVLLVCGIALLLMPRPYNQIIFTLHKLAALALAVSSGIQIKTLIDSSKLNGIALAAFITAIISLVLLFASGAILGIIDNTPENPPAISAGVLLIIHRAATITCGLSIIGIWL